MKIVAYLKLLKTRISEVTVGLRTWNGNSFTSMSRTVSLESQDATKLFLAKFAAITRNFYSSSSSSTEKEKKPDLRNN